MKWFRRFISQDHRRQEDPAFRDKLHMLQEVRKAHADWISAHMKLDWVVEKDQIDYAIYALEAAEKRYVMLLRQAKQLGWEDGVHVASHVHRAVQVRMHNDKRDKGKVSGY